MCGRVQWQQGAVCWQSGLLACFPSLSSTRCCCCCCWPALSVCRLPHVPPLQLKPSFSGGEGGDGGAKRRREGEAGEGGEQAPSGDEAAGASKRLRLADAFDDAAGE